MNADNLWDTNINAFLESLEQVPWFSTVGQPLSPVDGIERLSSWSEWPGPADGAILELSWQHQALYDEIMENAGSQRQDLCDLWDHIHEIVFRVAAPRVPYDPHQDCYHGPTTAVWQVAWTAGLIGLCIYLHRPIHDELQRQWGWFLQGRWPSGYAGSPSDGQTMPLLVY